MTGYVKPITMERIKARCVECGECWEWQGSCNGRGSPKIAWIDDGRRTQVSARRVVWMLGRGPLPAGKLVTVACQNVRCLNPAHLKLTTKAAIARRTNAEAGTRLKRMVNCAKTQREKFGKITMDIAREIRAGEKTGVQWARELNCSVSLISNVRKNRSWRETSTPFAGLMP